MILNTIHAHVHVVKYKTARAGLRNTTTLIIAPDIKLYPNLYLQLEEYHMVHVHVLYPNLHVASLVVELSPDVDVGCSGSHAASSHQTPLHQLVRIVSHYLSVLAGSRLSLISVHNQITRPGAREWCSSHARIQHMYMSIRTCILNSCIYSVYNTSQ